MRLNFKDSDCKVHGEDRGGEGGRDFAAMPRLFVLLSAFVHYT